MLIKTTFWQYSALYGGLWVKRGDAQLAKGEQKAQRYWGGGCYYSVLHCVLPGLGLIQTLLCDGHNLLEDVTHVLLRLTQVVVFPYVVRIAQILLRQSNVTQHHVAVVLHRSKCATYCHMMGPGSFSNFQHLAKG